MQSKTKFVSSHSGFMVDVWIVSWMRVLLDGWPCGLMGGLVDGWIEGYGTDTQQDKQSTQQEKLTQIQRFLDNSV